MAAANDNVRRKRKKRERAEGQRAVATMTRIIQDLYASYGRQQPVAASRAPILSTTCATIRP
jgi:hypothetical protein